MAGVTLGGKVKVYARGVFKGEFMELAYSTPRPPLAVGLALASLQTFKEVVQRVTRAWEDSWNIVLDEQAALDAFIADGGDPAFILAVERAYEVTWDD